MSRPATSTVAPAPPPVAAAPSAVSDVPAAEVQSLRDVNPALHKILYGNDYPLLSGLLAQAEEKSGIKREKIFNGVISVIGIYLVLGRLAEIVCNLIGVAYPLYASIKAVHTANKEDDTEWLIYWCCYATYSLIDFFAESIWRWFPFYWLFKALFLIYLAAPQTHGAIRFYKKVVIPIYHRFEEVLEELRQKIKSHTL